MDILAPNITIVEEINSSKYVHTPFDKFSI